MAAIKHEHLVTVYQAGREGDVFYLAMELLQGQTLDARLHRAEQMSAPEILCVAREICAGLAVIHQHGLIHRDIKPANIWLEAPNGHVKILDFGLARSTVSSNTSNLTERGTVVGTPAYMSPEHARGENIDARSDLFSLGCVLYNLCTGTKPFKGDSLLAQLTALAVDTPRPAHEISPHIPKALSNLVTMLLAKDPAARPGSAELVIERITAIENGLADNETVEIAGMPKKQASRGGTAAPAQNSAPATPERRWIPVALTLALVLIAALVVLNYKPTPQQQNVAKATPDVPPPVKTTVTPTPEPEMERPPRRQPEQFDARPPDRERDRERPPRRAQLTPQQIEEIQRILKAHVGDKAPRVYATEIPIGEMAAVYFPKATGLPGRRLPFEPPKLFPDFSIQGESSVHAMGMHPLEEGPAFANFKLEGKYSTFSVVVSQNDGPPPASAPMIFAVIGDGNKVLWESKPVSSQKDTQACVDLSVKGVKELRLEVSADGERPRATHALWFEPYFRK